MIRIAPALAVSALQVWRAGVPPALGAFPADNGRITFFSDRQGGDFEIWTAEATMALQIGCRNVAGDVAALQALSRDAL
jgi:hypothetical protein